MDNVENFLDAIEESVETYCRLDRDGQNYAAEAALSKLNHLRIRTQHFEDVLPSVLHSRCKKIAHVYGCEFRMDDDVIVFVRQQVGGGVS